MLDGWLLGELGVLWLLRVLRVWRCLVGGLRRERLSLLWWLETAHLGTALGYAGLLHRRRSLEHTWLGHALGRLRIPRLLLHHILLRSGRPARCMLLRLCRRRVHSMWSMRLLLAR